MEGIMCKIRRTIIGQLLIISLSVPLALADSSRFIDNGNGTVTDSLTVLVWLKNAGCTQTVGGISSQDFTWANSFIWSQSMATGYCGLSDNSIAGHWRLPTIAELQSLGPTFPIDYPFTSVKGYYWSKDTCPDGTCAKALNMGTGGTYNFDKTVGWAYILPVSGGVVLTITKAGTGGGEVIPDPGLIIWSGNTGTAGYARDTVVTLHASANQSSTFEGWSGAGCSGTQDCPVTMDNVKTVTATFTAVPNARTGGELYTTLNYAYDAVTVDGIIDAKAIVFNENLTLDRGIDFTLNGGFSDDFGDQPGYTTLNGVLSVDTGSVDVDRLIIGYVSGSTL
jgi:hypothetical protein